MDFIKIIFAIMVSGMAVSIGFALGIVAGATVITRITFSKQTEQKVLHIWCNRYGNRYFMQHVVCSKAVLEMSRQRREKTCSRRSSKNRERDRNGKNR